MRKRQTKAFYIIWGIILLLSFQSAVRLAAQSKRKQNKEDSKRNEFHIPKVIPGGWKKKQPTGGLLPAIISAFQERNKRSWIGQILTFGANLGPRQIEPPLILSIVIQLPSNLPSLELRFSPSKWSGTMILAKDKNGTSILPKALKDRKLKFKGVTQDKKYVVFDICLNKPAGKVPTMKTAQGQIKYQWATAAKKVDVGISSFCEGAKGTKLGTYINRIEENWKGLGQDLKLNIDLPINLIKNVTFLDKKGNKLKTRKDSSNSDLKESEITFYLEGRFPPKGRIFVETYSLKTIYLDFEIPKVVFKKLSRESSIHKITGMKKKGRNIWLTKRPNTQEVAGNYQLEAQTLVEGGLLPFKGSECRLVLNEDGTFKISNYPDVWLTLSANRFIPSTFKNASGTWNINSVGLCPGDGV